LEFYTSTQAANSLDKDKISSFNLLVVDIIAILLIYFTVGKMKLKDLESQKFCVSNGKWKIL